MSVRLSVVSEQLVLLFEAQKRLEAGADEGPKEILDLLTCFSQHVLVDAKHSVLQRARAEAEGDDKRKSDSHRLQQLQELVEELHDDVAAARQSELNHISQVCSVRKDLSECQTQLWACRRVAPGTPASAAPPDDDDELNNLRAQNAHLSALLRVASSQLDAQAAVRSSPLPVSPMESRCSSGYALPDRKPYISADDVVPVVRAAACIQTWWRSTRRATGGGGGGGGQDDRQDKLDVDTRILLNKTIRAGASSPTSSRHSVAESWRGHRALSVLKRLGKPKCNGRQSLHVRSASLF